MGKHTVLAALVLACITTSSFAFANSIFFSNPKDITLDGDGKATKVQTWPDDFPTGKTEHEGKIVPVKKVQITKTLSGAPNQVIKNIRHTFVLKWDPLPPPKDDKRKITFTMVREFDPDDSVLTITGFSLGEVALDDISLELEDVGIFSPVSTMTIPISDLGAASEVGDLFDDVIDPSASGLVPIALFELPADNFAVVSEPATIALLAIGAIGMLGNRWRARKRISGVGR